MQDSNVRKMISDNQVPSSKVVAGKTLNARFKRFGNDTDNQVISINYAAVNTLNARFKRYGIDFRQSSQLIQLNLDD